MENYITNRSRRERYAVSKKMTTLCVQVNNHCTAVALTVLWIYTLLKREVMLHFIQSKDEQMRILRACHVDATAGHMGKTRTIYKIKERFMWHGMVKDVKDLVCSVDCITLATFPL